MRKKDQFRFYYLYRKGVNVEAIYRWWPYSSIDQFSKLSSSAYFPNFKKVFMVLSILRPPIFRKERTAQNCWAQWQQQIIEVTQKPTSIQSGQSGRDAMEYDLKRKLIVRLLTLVALLYQKESLTKVGFPKMFFCKNC